jgi:hypothetical protein
MFSQALVFQLPAFDVTLRKMKRALRGATNITFHVVTIREKFGGPPLIRAE